MVAGKAVFLTENAVASKGSLIADSREENS
jgi:hypothetical protein